MRLLLQFSAILLISGLLGSCGHPTSPTPIEKLPDWMISEWKLGQEFLIDNYCYDPDQVYGVHPEYFNWKYQYGVFKCGGKEANGCFSTPRSITINIKTKNAARHETMHAILFRIDEDNWKKPQHDKEFRGLCKED